MGREDGSLRADGTDDVFRLALAHAGIGMALIAPDGSFLEVNAALCDLLGRDETALTSSTWQELTHPDDLGVDLALVKEVLDGRRDGYRLSKRYLKPDGSVVQGDLTVAAVREAAGEVRFFVSQIVDESDQVELRERYRLLAENASDVIAMGDNEGIIRWISPSVTPTLGWEPSDLAGTPFAALIEPEDRPVIAATQADVLVGRTVEVEVRMRTNVGDSRWMVVRVKPVLDESGAVVGRVGSWWSADEQRRARQALAASEERLRAALDAEIDAHVFLSAERDESGRIIDFVFSHANDRAGAYLRREVGDLLGKPLLALFPGQRTSGMFDRYCAVIETGEPMVLDGLRIPSEIAGELRYFDFRGVRFQDSVSLIWRDVTDRVLAEEALEESERQARELAERYEVARNEALEANLAKTAFLSRMSHELRTPLNAVLGFAQLLAMDPLTPEQREAVESIRTGGRHLLDLISEILDISRIEAGRLSLSMEPVSVSDAVQEALDLVRSLAQDLHVTMDPLEEEACQGTVWADRQRVIQILINLLSNAVKYNRPGGRVWVTCSPTEDGASAISICDDGIGIPSAVMDRLFEPFDRLGAESTRVEGTGIGLALSRGLAVAMGGRIDVESESGRGSVFSLVLRQVGDVPDDVGMRPIPSIPVAGRATRVLYIEDNPANMNLMRRIVGLREGTTLDLADDGASGLQLALASPPNLILLDLHLPDIPGEDVLRRLRAARQTAEVPVVVVTADASAATRHRALDLGANGVILKPVDVAEVLAWVDDPSGRRFEP